MAGGWFLAIGRGFAGSIIEEGSNARVSVWVGMIQVREHEVAIATLKTLPADRKTFRLISDVMVEQTAGQTLQEVTSNQENIAKVLEETVKQSVQIEKDVREMSLKS